MGLSAELKEVGLKAHRDSGKKLSRERRQALTFSSSMGSSDGPEHC